MRLEGLRVWRQVTAAGSRGEDDVQLLPQSVPYLPRHCL